MDSINKKAIVKQVANKLDFTQKDVGDVIDSFLEAIIESLKQGIGVGLTGFGKFEVVTRESRKSRNPRTGEDIIVPERKAPKFRPSNQFKMAIV